MTGWELNPDFSEESVRTALRIYGFVLIRGVLTAAEVVAVRGELDAGFAVPYQKDLGSLCTTEVLKYAPVWNTLFKDAVVRSLRAALGPELYYQNDMDVQRNNFGQRGWRLHTGWHMDAGSETGNGYLRSQHYRFVKCGIFLQDFANGWGGGIRIKPKSHRGLFEPNPMKRRLFFARRALNRLAHMLRFDVDTFDVPTRAGDLCFFDSRLLHSSMPPRWANIRSIGYERNPQIVGFWPDIPREHTKYVIYWDACNAAMVDDFLRNSARRAATEPEGMREERMRPAVFTRVLANRYPEDFPRQFVATATRCDVGVASLGAQEAEVFRRKLQTMQLMHP